MSGLTLEPFPRASGAALSSVSLFFVLVETGNLAHVRTHLINRDHVLRDFPLVRPSGNVPLN